jgi:NAD-dependent deacetylase
MSYPSIAIDDTTRVLVLTGAGVSAESGLATFRGSGGLWEGSRIEDVATPEAFDADPERVWRFYSDRRVGAGEARPNAAHIALAAAEARMGDRFLLATQNVDGLHGLAGSRRLLEIHGSLWRTCCSACDAPAFEDRATPVLPPLPRCRACGGLVRPDIVWFGEMLDPAHEWAVRQFVKAADAAGARLVFLAIGTSGNVYPAAGYVRYARDMGAETWLANADEAANAHWFDHVVTGPATAVVPALLGIA